MCIKFLLSLEIHIENTYIYILYYSLSLKKRFKHFLIIFFKIHTKSDKCFCYKYVKNQKENTHNYFWQFLLLLSVCWIYFIYVFLIRFCLFSCIFFHSAILRTLSLCLFVYFSQLQMHGVFSRTREKQIGFFWVVLEQWGSNRVAISSTFNAT